MPNSPHTIHGLIISMEYNLPGDLALDKISLFSLLPSQADRSNWEFFSQLKEALNSMLCHRCPGLEHPLLYSIDFNGNIEAMLSISQLKLDFTYLRKCDFKTVDPMWSTLIDSVELFNLMRQGNY